MKLTHGLAALALSLTAVAAQAEITGNAAVLSDYNWRGITQTSQDPALQGGIDYAHESGFYLGAGAATSISATAATRTSKSTSTRASVVAKPSPGTSA